MSKIISADDLGIDLEGANEAELFKWLIASFMMGKKIQGLTAAMAYQVIVEKHNRDTLHKFASCTHRQ